MSHQYNPFWFPECFLCEMGNLPGAICLLHSCHERRGLIRVDEDTDLEVVLDGHSWKGCQFCEQQMLADPGSWGSFALCTDCWNLYVEAERFPPTSTYLLARELLSRKLEIGWDAATRTKVRVLP
jgi:hypothetical protein